MLSNGGEGDWLTKSIKLTALPKLIYLAYSYIPQRVESRVDSGSAKTVCSLCRRLQCLSWKNSMVQSCDITHFSWICYNQINTVRLATKIWHWTAIDLQILLCFSFNLAHFSYALWLPSCVVHLEICLHNHRPKNAFRRLYCVNGFTQADVNDVALVWARIVWSNRENQQYTHSSSLTTRTVAPQNSASFHINLTNLHEKITKSYA